MGPNSFSVGGDLNEGDVCLCAVAPVRGGFLLAVSLDVGGSDWPFIV